MSNRYEYSHPQGYHVSYPDEPPKTRSKSSKYTPAKIESDLRRTVSFLSRVLQNEFLNPPAGQSHRSASSAREHGFARKDGGDMTFDEVLLKGRKKLEKLVRRYRELNPTSSSPRAAEYSTSNNRGDEDTAYYEQRERSTGDGGHWQQADEIEEVESVRPSRHKSSNSRAHTYHHHHHHGVPPAPSPPRSTSRDAHDWAGINPDYHPSTSTPHGYSSHTHGGHSYTAPTKRKGTGLSFDKFNLPALIAHAGIIMGIIEKVLAVKSGGSHGHRSGGGSGGSLHTAVKVVKMVVALSEGLGLAGSSGRPEGSRRHTY